MAHGVEVLHDGELSQLRSHRLKLFPSTKARQQLAAQLLPSSRALALLDTKELVALGGQALHSGYSILDGLEAMLPSAASLAESIGNQTRSAVRVAAYSGSET